MTRTQHLFVVLMSVCLSVCTGQETVCRQEAKADIVFLVDGSWSIGTDNFQQIRDFLYTLVNSFSVGPDHVQIGLVQYSHNPKTEFLLNTYENKQDILDYIKKLPYKGGGTMTGLGLDFLLKEQFTEQAGSRVRQGVPQIAVVLTDGQSTDQVESHADDLRHQGIILYAIGIKDADEEELKKIGNEPHDQHVFSVSDFNALQGISQNIVKVLCTTVEEVQRQISQEFADIFFLVDSSTKPPQFQLIRTILSRLANQLNVSIDSNRMGLAQFSDDTNVEFHLNDYKTKEDVLAHLKRFRLKSGGARNIGAALDYTRINLLTPATGARTYPGFQQYLVLMASGKSDDSVYRPSQTLKDQRINVITVGLDNADPLEMQIIATKPSMAKSVGKNGGQIPQEIRSIVEDIKKLTEASETFAVTDECLQATVSDIIFLVDQSSATSSENFNLVRNFLYNTVAGLDISPNKVRVGVVMYSTVPKAIMYLNTYDTKQDILYHIRRLPYVKSAIAKTGEALRFARTDVLTKMRGSRHEISIPQLAIVITNGHSADNVNQAAMDLRQLGLKILTVGLQSPNKTQLEQIASHPPSTFMFSVDNFAKLNTIQRDVRASICHETNQRRERPYSPKLTSARTAWRSVYNFLRNSVVRQDCLKTEEADMYFLIDESGSITENEFQIMKKFILELLLTFHVGPKQVRVGLVKFASSPKLEFDLLQTTDRAALDAAVQKVYLDGGGTNIGLALTEMQKLFKEAVASRPNPEVPRMLIVITDGKSQDDVREPAKILRDQGVIIYTIGVKDANQQELEEISDDPKRTFRVNNFDALLSIKDVIVQKMCSREACKDMKADVLWLVESSDIISSADFVKTKLFVETLMDQSVIGADALHMGLVQYGSRPQVEFPLSYEKTEMREKTSNMHELGGSTETGEALQYVAQFFDTEHGGRLGVPHILIVVSEGKSRDDVTDPANTLKQMGVIIYTIGIGSANSQEMATVSSSPDNYFFLRNFDELKSVADNIMSGICNVNKGCQIEKADMLFLVDGSTGVTEEQLQRIQTFMIAVVNSSSVGQEVKHVRIGVVIYSTEPQIQFALNEYDTRKELRQAISHLKLVRGEPYTSRALEYTLNYFSEAHGGRNIELAQKLLVVITSEDARDAQHLREASAKLRHNHVKIYGVGVKQGNDEELAEQLLTITNNKDRVFILDNFNSLEQLGRDLSQNICKDKQLDCKMDLVMLMDGSNSIHADDFRLMKTFMTDMVKLFRIGPDYVQVGVVQFCAKPEDIRQEFYLNDFENVDDIVRNITAIKKIDQGNSISAGLNFSKASFTARHGSRRDKGVRQVLLLFTDGETEEEEVSAVADELRAMGVDLFVIGIGRIQTDQLNKIGREQLFIVDDFKKLPDIMMKLVDSMCDDKDEPVVEGCHVDIAVGFDITQRSEKPALLHGHDQLKHQLPRIFSKMSTLDSICCVPTAVIKPRFAFSLVNQAGQELEYFPFEEYNAEVVQKVTSLATNEDTFLNTEFLQSFQRIFKQSQAEVKVVLIFSDGLDEPVENLELVSDQLKRGGISTLLTVALEGTHNAPELQMIDFGRGFGLKQPLSIRMDHLDSALQRDMVAVTLRDCCGVGCICTGPPGHPGSEGGPGQKGDKGFPGFPGFPGDDGTSGGKGPPGLNGAKGEEGCQGKRGEKGGRGFTGETGGPGEDGLDGVHGQQGDTGRSGAMGGKGDHGNPGYAGVKGAQGADGAKGLRGDPGAPGRDNTSQGPKGERGNQGTRGESGGDGSSGEDGPPGNNGQDGRRGPPGEQGVRGDPGDSGMEGVPGPIGPQGQRGAAGPDGPAGSLGLPGPQGPQGIDGFKGSKGHAGMKGQKGLQGELGAKGIEGSRGARGPPGMDGRDGYGPTGAQGQKGDPGFPGYPGLQGEDGVKGQAGGPGPKGIQGRGGDAGAAGAVGDPGDHGVEGHRGQRGAAGNKTDICQLLPYIRDNCVCCGGQPECPVYPTELVLALDMSEDVDNQAFQKMHNGMTELLRGISVAESNCPRGARVAVVSYNSITKQLVRFTDHKQKKTLLDAVNSIALERSSGRRNIGSAMQFVARHVFKRTRPGALMRRVAVFFSNGASQDVTNINTAMLELKAFNIQTAVVALKDTPYVRRAFEADETRSFIVQALQEEQGQEQLSRIKNCAICYDFCQPHSECHDIVLHLNVDLDLDLSVLLEGSQTMQADKYVAIKDLLASVLEQIKVSSQPQNSDKQARVALYQASPSYHPDQAQTTQTPIQKEFDFLSYNNTEDMRKHLLEDVHQLGSSAALGNSLEWVLQKGLTDVPNPRKHKMVLAVVSDKTKVGDEAKLAEMSRLAKCQGVGVFVLTTGHKFDGSQVKDLASSPLDQHIVHLGDMKQGEPQYARQFLQALLGTLNRDFNNYRVPQMCDQQSTSVLLAADGPKLETLPLPAQLRQVPHAGEGEQRTPQQAAPSSRIATRPSRPLKPLSKKKRIRARSHVGGPPSSLDPSRGI